MCGKSKTFEESGQLDRQQFPLCAGDRHPNATLDGV